jgi:hypothetical protein
LTFAVEPSAQKNYSKSRPVLTKRYKKIITEEFSNNIKFTPKLEIKLLGIAKFLEEQNMYRVIISDCPIAVGVENPHKFGMCR